MPRFFITGCEFEPGKPFKITGDDAFHIMKSLRMKPGEEITVCDGLGDNYRSIIKSFDDEGVNIEITDITAVDGEPEIKVNLFTAITKGEGFEYAIQKCIEAGVHSITPLITERTIVSIKPGKSNKKLERWNRIALEAAKQSGRSIIPQVHKPVKFKEAVAGINKDEPCAICYIEEGTLSLKRFLKEKRGSKTFNILIGPEGGFTEEEWKAAVDNKIESVSLGDRILKAETAGLFATAAIMYEFDQLDKKAEKQSKGE